MNTTIEIIGYGLIVLGVGHGITGIVLFRRPLAAMWRNGFFNAVAAHLDRRAAFWFMVFSAFLLLAGQTTLRAIATADLPLLRIVGWHMLVIGAIGAAALPRTPFWIALLCAPILLWSGYAP